MQNGDSEGTALELLDLGSSPSPELTATLRDLVQRLRAADYELVRSLPLPGGLPHIPLDLANLAYGLAGIDNQFHQTGLPALHAALMRSRSKSAVDLHRMFHLCRPVSRSLATKQLGEPLLERLLAAGLLREQTGKLISQAMFTPYPPHVFMSDPLRAKKHPDYVYLGRTSIAITDAVRESFEQRRSHSGGRMLDLGCGCGNIAITLAPYFDEVLGTDIVDRCLTVSRLNATLAEASNCEFRYSDLYDDVEGTFDCIVANPPCGWIDPSIETARAYSTGGDDYGTELPQRVLTGAFDRITANGRIFTTLTSPVIRGVPYVLQLLQQIFGERQAFAVVYPLFEEYSYKRARLYRRHGIEKMVRYLVVIDRRAGKFATRFETRDSLRLWSYRLRASIPRFVAAMRGGSEA